MVYKKRELKFTWMCLVLHATRHYAGIMFDSSLNYQFSSTIPHNKCTMYKAEPKDVKQKILSWGISGHTHVQVHIACKQTLSAMSGFNRRENGRKRERKNHESWVLTFVLILTGTTIDLPEFSLSTFD